jgi:L-ascorbate metabolism protein UlaG (beta-lactamase superfamily)
VHRAAPPPFPSHFNGKRFYNPKGQVAPGFLDVLHWSLTRRRERSARFVHDVKASKPPDSVEGSDLRVTLINHSTVLLQQSGINILTDPVWSERTSPFTWIGPRRRREAGVRLEDLPRIDVVLLSHNHYDHLDLSTLRSLTGDGQCEFVVPARVGRLLRSQGIGPVHELDWGESLQVAATIHCVPAVHFSARGLFDRNRTLWCGYVIETADRTVYFAGDTAFSNHFVRIRERFGSPRLALLPIGAFEPRWFMSPVHMSPEEAVHAHQLLGARTSIAIHHGTFQLGDDGIDTPRRRLLAYRPDDSFLILNNGQHATIS